MTKGPILEKLWDQLPEERKKRIKSRAKKLETEYVTLQELRQSAGLTQEELSKELNMRQENISRLEKRSDMLLSTLRDYIEAIGGKLSLTVELPGKRPIHLADFGDLLNSQKRSNVKRN